MKKIVSIICIVTSFFFFSCKNRTEKNIEYYSSQFEILKKSHEYQIVISSAEDTIKRWIDLDLKYFHRFKSDKWKLDDWIYLNSTQDKCIVSILVKNLRTSELDDVNFILCEKNQGKWWFYDGPDLMILQKNYTDDKTLLALPFDQIRIVARKYILQWYYNDNHKINDNYFEEGFNWSVDRREHGNFLKEKYAPR